MSNERLQKILAQAGIASRRKAEELIEQGLVTVNGAVAKLGDKADFTVDHIKVDGKLVRKLEDPFYVVMNKPKGVISMMGDPEGRPTIADFLSKMKVHLNPIGRLDFNSEGLLLLTNDGAMAEKIQKSDKFPRVYHVKIKGHITTEMIQRLERGGRVGEKFSKPLSVRIHEELNKKTKIEIVFVNASNVDLKTYFESKGFLVERITRTGIGHLTLHGLEPGQYRIVPKTKFEALFEQPELGVKAITHRHEKEREILPRDQRMRNVDEHGKVIPKAGSDAAIKAARVSRIAAAKSEDGVAAPSKEKKKDRIVVRAPGAEPAPKKRAGYSDSVDMPSFKRRSNAGFGARSPRTSDDRAPRADSRGPRADSRARPMSDSRGARSDNRGPRSDSRGPRPDSRGPRSDSRGPRADSRGPRAAFGGRDSKPRFAPRAEGAPRRERPSGGAGFTRRPIARVKRRET